MPARLRFVFDTNAIINALTQGNGFGRQAAYPPRHWAAIAYHNLNRSYAVQAHLGYLPPAYWGDELVITQYVAESRKYRTVLGPKTL